MEVVRLDDKITDLQAELTIGLDELEEKTLTKMEF
jgi:hypothetical protein